ncbi:galactokinase [Corynebacterium sp. 335C]
MTAVEPQWMPLRDREAAADDAVALFRERFGADPAGCWAAPGRVNLIGEHVDYAGGICLPFALGQSTVVAAAPRDDAILRVASAYGGDVHEAEIDLREVGPEGPRGWTGYVAGAVWAATEAGVAPAGDDGAPRGLDLAIVSDVPVGAGLSSSAALECSAALAAVELATGRAAGDDDRRALVGACMRAENEVVGASTGGLDQRIALFGREGMALAIDFAEDSDELVPCDVAAEGLAILVTDTNAPHSLADGQYATRRGVIDGVTEEAGAETLRVADDPHGAAERWADRTVPEGMDAGEWRDVVARRVRHVLSEVERTAGAIGELRDGDFAAFGRSMCASHASLRDDYEVTCPELDLVVDEAMAVGALGARMTGGGFGGSAIALLPEDRVEEAAARIAAAFAAAGFAEPRFAVATPSAGAARVR